MKIDKLARIVCALWLLSTGLATAQSLPKMRPGHPRVFLRQEAWNGPSVEKIRSWMDRPEYKARLAKVRNRVNTSELKNSLLASLWLFDNDVEAGRELLQRFMQQRTKGRSPSYWGIVDQQMAAYYDWLYHHPDFTEEMKADRRHYLNLRCQFNMNYLRNHKENPFYSRFSGALGSLTACALAIADEHPRGQEYLEAAYRIMREKMGTIRQAEDGATGGASYGFMHEFTDLANAVAVWRSATDWDAAQWIKEHQGNWLERQMLFQIWMTYPNGTFVKDGDSWDRDTRDNWQYRMSLDAITGMYRNGFGRTHADRIYQRYGLDDYHLFHMWQWFVFNDPAVPARPLSELGRTEVFSPDLHGMVAWRSGWEDDATIVHFRAGESPDTHGTADQGKFIIFKQRPLAIKNGDYIGWRSDVHNYYRTPWSANCLVFVRKGANGKAQALNFPKFGGINRNEWPKGLFSWDEWKTLRERAMQRETKWASPPMGKLIEHEANDRFARARADLSLRSPLVDGKSPGAQWEWTREMVFLDYTYLLVLDRVKPGNNIEHRWTLHTTFEPTLDGTLAVADNGPARLFCKTLLPEKPVLKKVGGPGFECDWHGRNALPKGWKSIIKTEEGELAYTTASKESAQPVVRKLGPHSQMGAWRLDVTPSNAGEETVYLHVLFPTDTSTKTMPACSVTGENDRWTVKVGERTHTFAPPASAKEKTASGT
jgi:hypothetical protein